MIENDVLNHTNDSRIKVSVRVRPLSKFEQTTGARINIAINKKSHQCTITNPTNGEQKIFSFDKVYDFYATQHQVWNDIGKELLEAAWSGYNYSLFAYGQTGSGKTYSMLGFGEDENSKGILPRACEAIFEKIGSSAKHIDPESEISFKVESSMLEIYNERIRDLLAPGKYQHRSGLKLRDIPQKGVYVEGLKEVTVSSAKQIRRLLDYGTRNRTVAATNMNENSSRSHTIFTINLITTLVNRKTMQVSNKTSTISFVDLAGSERIGKSSLEDSRLVEGSFINKSLSALGNVINVLAKKAKLNSTQNNIVVPYRNSVLTHLMRSSLGGNSKTTMIATISPADSNFAESLSTLRYSNRAKKVKNQAVINTDPNEELIRLKKQLRCLKEKLQERESSRETIEAELKSAYEEELKKQRTKWDEQFQLEFGKERLEHRNSPYLSNLNEDNSLTDKLRFYLNEGANYIGSSDLSLKTNGKMEKYNIFLNGIDIMANHSVITYQKNVNSDTISLSLRSYDGCKTILNGTPLHSNEESGLTHGDRIIFGHYSIFIIVVDSEIPITVDWEIAMKEANKKYFNTRNLELESATKLRQEMELRVRSLQNQLEREKSNVILTDEVRSGWKGKHRHLHEQIRENEIILKKKSRELQERAFIDKQLVEVLPLVQEANSISCALNKNVSLQAKLVCKPIDKFDPLDNRERGDYVTELTVQLFNHPNKFPNVWSIPTFLNRVYEMKELYHTWLDSGDITESESQPDPFIYDPRDHLLGSVIVQLEALFYMLDIHDSFPVVDYAGRSQGEIDVRITPLLIDHANDKSKTLVELIESPSKSMTFLIKVMNARGLPNEVVETFQSFYIKFRFLSNVWQESQKFHLSGNNPEMFYETNSTTKITTELCNFLKLEGISIELWVSYDKPSAAKQTQLKGDNSTVKDISLIKINQSLLIKINNLTKALAVKEEEIKCLKLSQSSRNH